LYKAFVLTDELFFEAGARVAALRGAMKQSVFAEQLGVHRNSVVGWEAGKRLPDGESLLRMHEVFGADVTFLLTGKTGGVTPLLPPDEEQLLEHYRQANSDGRERIRQISATAANSPKRTPPQPKADTSTSVEGEANEIKSNHDRVKVKGNNNKVMTLSRK
jgi:transcriptional regulator with XRE-family HTH domain